MRKPIVIIEKEETVPAEILSWASSHSVPVIHENSSVGKTPVAAEKSGDDNPISDYDYVIEYSEDITTDYLDTAYCHAHNLPADITSTSRLVIREIGPEDLDSYREILCKYPEAVSDPTLLNLPFDEFKDRHLAYMKYSYSLLGYGIWGIFLKNTEDDITSKMIGIAGLDGTGIPSLSYALFEEYQGMGYASEACKAIIDYAVCNHEINRINLCVKQDNTSSLKLARKLITLYPDTLSILEERP